MSPNNHSIYAFIDRIWRQRRCKLFLNRIKQQSIQTLIDVAALPRFQFLYPRPIGPIDTNNLDVTSYHNKVTLNFNAQSFIENDFRLAPFGELETSTPSVRSRILLLAFCFSPNGTMEERNGWHRALMAAKRHHVTVLYCPKNEFDRFEKELPDSLPEDAIQFVPVAHRWWSQALASHEWSFYFGYRLWHRIAAKKAKMLHHGKPFDLVHFVTLCGFREPGYLWQMDVPHIIGPLGGTHYFPARFFKLLTLGSRIREAFRSLVNYFQLAWCPRISKAVRNSAMVVAATREGRMVLERSFGIEVEHDLETGLDYEIPPKRSPRDNDRPFRILWTGRLRAWKGLPILLHALSQLPASPQIQVRVLGSGSCRQEWQKLAKRLGLANHIEWIEWPTYRETLAHYQWADVFAFTSLRDTSGTGLLESLAAGCPIIGLNHQGAADIMTQDCAIPVEVTEVSSTIASFARAIDVLRRDPNLWLQLSHGASNRASDFQWSRRDEKMLNLYGKVLARH